MKIEQLSTNVAAIGSPARAKAELFWVILGVFQSIRVAIVVGEPLCDLETPSYGLKALFRTV